MQITTRLPASSSENSTDCPIERYTTRRKRRENIMICKTFEWQAQVLKIAILSSELFPSPKYQSNLSPDVPFVPRLLG
jgi:hypothetical protein